MNNKGTIATLLLTPSLAWASGSDVLSLLWLGFLVFVIVLGSHYLAKFPVIKGPEGLNFDQSSEVVK